MFTSFDRAWLTCSVEKMSAKDWIGIGALLLIAIILRLVFYTGPLGSDDVVYTEVANQIANGHWQASNYIGATRYGVNLPVAFFIYLLGPSEFSANLWSFITSIGEVVLVYLIARFLWGTRAAVLSAGLLALLPIHVHYAGRLMADSPLAFFMTLSIALSIYAARVRSPLIYLTAGLAWGGVFWVKESVGILYFPIQVLLAFGLVDRWSRVFWLIGGALTALAANCMLFYVVTADPMHVFKVMKIATLRVNSMDVATSPLFYVKYLFMDIKHTLFIGYLFMGGALLWGRVYLQKKSNDHGAGFVFLWSLLLLTMYSLAIVSFHPVKLIMKQVNYMLIFAAPMVLLSGWYLDKLPRKILFPLSMFIVFGSFMLCALEQQSIQVFTANGRAAYEFLIKHPNSHLIGKAVDRGIINFYAAIENRPDVQARFSTFSQLDAQGIISDEYGIRLNSPNKKNTFALAFTQDAKLGHMKDSGILRLSNAPKAWTPCGRIVPASLGLGRRVTSSLLLAGNALPLNMQHRYVAALQSVTTPDPAYLFQVGGGVCAS